MAEQLTRDMLQEAADIHQEIPAAAKPHQLDRTFELPKGLYATTVGLFLGYIALMGVGFAHPEMIVPLVIFAFFVVAGFGVPAIWTRLAPPVSGPTKSKAMSWAKFQRDGIMTETGRASARDATVQVLILPVLIFLWGVAAVTIAALVG